MDAEDAASPADIDAWLNAAVRPDLYGDAAPIQRKASGQEAQAAAARSAPTGGGQALPARGAGQDEQGLRHRLLVGACP